MLRFGSSMEAPYTGRQAYRWWVILLRLLVGLPILDRMTRHGPTFFRSRLRAEQRPNLNPCQDWPGWARFGWRVAVVAIVYGWINYRWITVALMVLCLAGVVALLILNRSSLYHRAEVVEPLFGGLVKKMQVKIPVEDAGKFLHVPRDYASGGKITLRLPPDFDPPAKMQEAMNSVVARKLGIDVSADWDFESGLVTWTRLDAPTMVRFDHTIVGEQRMIPIGQDVFSRWCYIDLEGKTPHVLVSAQTGWGKTVFLMMTAAWLVVRGAKVFICDPKRIGFLKLRGVKNIQLDTAPETMIQTILDFKESMEAVYAAAERGEDIDDETRFPTKVLYLDELGTLIEMIKDDWKDRKGQGTPPALTAIKYILWQGRAARHYVFAGCQHANEDTLISQDCKDQFGCKIAAGPQSVSSWRVLFGYEKRIRVPKRKGAAAWAAGDSPEQIQLTFVEEDEALQIATTPVVTDSDAPDVRESVTPDGPARTLEPVPDTAETPDSASDQQENTEEGEEEEPLVVGCPEGAAFLGMSESAFEKARQRSGGIPGEKRIKNRPAWREQDLLNWHTQKKIAGKTHPRKNLTKTA